MTGMRQRGRRLPLTRGATAILLFALSAGTLCGCNYVILAGYLLGGPPSIEPKFDVATHKSMTDKDVTVAVVCYAPPEIKWDNHRIDQEVSKYVSFRLRDKHIQVVHPDQVVVWLDENDDWDNPQEIGEALDVTYVVYIDLTKFSLYEEHSHNLFRGRAEAGVKVYDMTQNGDVIYSTDISSKYPLKVARSTFEISHAKFKAEYLSRLSEEIGRLFYEHYFGDDFADAT